MTAPRTSTRGKRADVLSAFHPAVAGWFRAHFKAPTQAQVQAWPAIQAGESTLVAAPTGSGKTLTAFLSAIDALVREGLDNGGVLPDRTTVVYVSPLKALSNDIRINLEEPLAGIRAALGEMGLPEVDIRTAVRTGDTTTKEREAMRKQVPHILVTTPESLYVLLGSDSGRAMLAGARSVIVDEIHALAASKRGSHLALSLERLQALCEAPLVRIGLSATQKPIEAVASFLVGRHAACRIVDIGYSRERDLNLEVPSAPLEAVMSYDVWDKVYDRLAELAGEHRTTLVFVNTRRLAERVTRHLAERIGAGWVAAHHGSLSKELRLGAEQRLKAIDWTKLASHYKQMPFNPVLWVQGISRVRLLQARGHFSEALHEITQLRGMLQPGWHGLQRLRLDLLAALSYQRLGYQERSHSLLGQCLVGAEREGVRSIFIEEGEGIRQLLQQLESTERQPALQVFIRGMLTVWPGQEARRSPEVLEEGLTDREREVVCLAAQGLSNEEIGQQLSLALGTVKWHLHNIYEKLKVRNRTQAIRRARELSLL